ncbi:hypothetical protein T06_9167 [Trichinella sp. T6]|nr:hypothetical protein T06_9167 [Trichinella sp. T6]
MERLVSSVKVAYRKYFGCFHAKPDELRMLLNDVEGKKSHRQLTIVNREGRPVQGDNPDQAALKMEELEKSGRALADALDAGILCGVLHPKVGDVVLVFEVNTPVLSHSLDGL